MNKRFIVVLVTILVLLSGCIQSQQLEQLGIIHTRGIDILEDEQIESTMSIFQFEAQSQNFTKIVSGTGKTVKGTLEDAGNKSNYRLVPGKLQLELFGQEVAKEGLISYLDTLRRDAIIPDALYLAVSATTAKDIMMVQEDKISSNIGQYLSELIEEVARDHNFPKVSLQEYMRIVGTTGKDPILPQFSIKDSNVPEISSIAIFSDDKYVGEIPINEMTLFNIMEKKIEARWIELMLPVEPLQQYIQNELSGETKEEKEGFFRTAYTVEQGKSKIKQSKENKLAFTTEIEMDLSLLEISLTYNLEEPDAVKALEKEVEKKLKARYESIMDQLQEMNADPFGYGVVYRINQDKEKLDRNEWKSIYPDIEVDFKVNVNIIRHGTLNK
ncbi:Ger(x)C family spore germination C-terminal domain-containing protein [Ornithinibacillus salinisoli]|uniref:Ger(X)C family spore germination C-terminal domain-containing protein n=1 Tax=Ornithinibacillus salinisoli TaxID=1848459 RepID=A0ABW4VW97_9BACI